MASFLRGYKLPPNLPPPCICFCRDYYKVNMKKKKKGGLKFGGKAKLGGSGSDSESEGGDVDVDVNVDVDIDAVVEQQEAEEGGEEEEG